ncbi:3D domain-containing protein [Paenibacillus jamilae]|uniref:3D domain-containing protein n=1 Tax=Paenibacillus jamilae TaxID=114136 RepID=UPI001428A258|nr:3D domain-containing protein [Paenibacillus jamilae]
MPKKPVAAKEPKKQKKATVHKKAKSKREIYNVTAYSLGDGYTPSHGVTASGERVQQGRTIACPRKLPFGTEVYIPSLNHTYVCTDRGGAIKSGHLDVYFKSVSDAEKFGRQWIEVEVRQK